MADNRKTVRGVQQALPLHKNGTELQPLFTFIDLFAGIGGFRIALEELGGKCLYSCEWDSHAQKTYRAWFNDTPESDIRDIAIEDIPNHDILAAGFPCQPFSIAGVSKKKSLGLAHGFEDATQGTLFFHLATIIEAKRPKVLFLENVKNLLSHEGGNTWKVIINTLTELDYHVNYQVLNASGWVPQHRERVYIVCFDKKVYKEAPNYIYPSPPNVRPNLASILQEDVDIKYTLSDHLWQYLKDYAQKHKEKGNGFGYGLADLNGVSRTLSARYYKDGSEILIPQGEGINPRRLTPRECARLMGFPEDKEIVVSDTQAYKQFGNAVVPLVIRDVAKKILEVIQSQKNASSIGKSIPGRRRVRTRASKVYHT